MCLNWNGFALSCLLSQHGVKVAILRIKKPEISMTNPSVGGGPATNSEYKIIQIQHNRIKNPNWQEETSRLFTSMAEDFNSGRHRTNRVSGQSRTRNWDHHIASPHADHSATLPPSWSYTSGAHLRKEFMSVLSSKWWRDKQVAHCTCQQTS